MSSYLPLRRHFSLASHDSLIEDLIEIDHSFPEVSFRWDHSTIDLQVRDGFRDRLRRAQYLVQAEEDFGNFNKDESCSLDLALFGQLLEQAFKPHS